MAQPNAIRQSTIPGLAIGDVSNADTTPSPSAARGEALDAGGGPPIVLPGAATIDGPAGTPSLRTLGNGAQQALPGNTPVDGAAGTASLRTLGNGAQQAMPGNTAIPGAVPDLSAVPELVIQAFGTMGAGLGSAIVLPGGGAAIAVGSVNGYQGIFRLPAPVVIAGKTAKLRLAGTLKAGAAAAFNVNTTVTQRLHAATSAAGVVTLGAQAIADDIITLAQLAADAQTSHESAWVTHPGAGFYIITLALSQGPNNAANYGARLELNYQ